MPKLLATRQLLSFSNGQQPVARITTDDAGNIVCPNDFPHTEHSNAVWLDWNQPEVWTCSGQPFATLEG